MKVCQKCVMVETYPGITFNEEGVCSICTSGNKPVKNKFENDFENESELIKCFEKHRSKNSKYDVLVPISGGVDSSNALITIVEKFKLKALAYHNDHGYEDETATNNVKKLCKELGVDLVILQQDLKFMKKLWKYANEAYVEGLSTCYVCGNILYLNALELAQRYDIKLLINGYSKGQAAMVDDKDRSSYFLEKQMEVIKNSGDKEFYREFIDKYSILEKKVAYKTKEDLEKRVDDGKIMVLPFYIFNFYKADKDGLKKMLQERFDWKPLKTSYPDRTTNCQMVWLNTYMDFLKAGYSMYNTEYSELVRIGELSREQAIKDLEFNPQMDLIKSLACDVGIDLERFKKQEDFTRIAQKEEKAEIKVEFEF